MTKSSIPELFHQMFRHHPCPVVLLRQSFGLRTSLGFDRPNIKTGDVFTLSGSDRLRPWELNIEFQYLTVFGLKQQSTTFINLQMEILSILLSSPSQPFFFRSVSSRWPRSKTLQDGVQTSSGLHHHPI